MLMKHRAYIHKTDNTPLERKWLLLDIRTWAKHSCHWLKYNGPAPALAANSNVNATMEGRWLFGRHWESISFWSSETAHSPLKLTVNPGEKASQKHLTQWAKSQLPPATMTSHPGAHAVTVLTAAPWHRERGALLFSSWLLWKIKPALKLEQVTS